MPPYNQFIYDPYWQYQQAMGLQIQSPEMQFSLQKKQEQPTNSFGINTIPTLQSQYGGINSFSLLQKDASSPLGLSVIGGNSAAPQTQYGAWGAIGGKVDVNSAAANTANKLSSPGAQMGYAAASMVGNAISDISDNAIRRNASDNAILADAVSGNSWGDVFTSGSKMAAARANINANQIDYSDVENNQNLLNAWNANDLQAGVQKENGWQTAGSIGGSVLADAAAGASIGSAVPVIGTAVGAIAGAISGLGRGVISAFQHNSNANDINAAVKRANEEQVRNFYDTAENNSQRQLRTEMRNYFQQGGYLQPDNGVTLFENGGSHQQNPLGGIPQGIATDGLPNLVEEGEVKYKDYIYTKRSKPSKALLKKYSLPEKYVGKTFAEIAMALQKASEDRPNDPIALTTLQEMMARLQGSQEEYKAKQEERQLARAFDKLSTEEKVGLAQIAMQQQAAQEEQMAQAEQAQAMQQPQPMGIGAMQFAQGGKIHIDPSKKGTFTAAATKHGMGVQAFASHVLANKDKFSSTMVKKANFARNASHWHQDGGTLPFYHTAGVENLLSGNLVDEANYNNAAYFSNIVDEKGAYRPYYKSWVQGLTNDDFTYLQTLMDDKTKRINPDLETFRRRALDSRFENTHSFINSLYRQPAAEPVIDNPVVEQPVVDNTAVVTTPTVRATPSETVVDNTPLGTVEDNWMRAAPILGSGIGAIAALATPADMTYANRLNNLAASYQPIAPQLLGGYRRYNPYDINLANAEATAQAAAMQRANRANTNRGTQTANAIALENAYERQNATRNLAWQQANEERRAGVDAYNLGIDKINAGTVQHYDDLNSQIRDKRVAMQAASAQAADQATTLRSQNISTALTNLFNNLGAYGKERMGISMINQATKDQVLKNPWLIASVFGA